MSNEARGKPDADESIDTVKYRNVKPPLKYNTSLYVSKEKDTVYTADIDNEDRKVLEDLIGRYTHNE